MYNNVISKRGILPFGLIPRSTHSLQLRDGHHRSVAALRLEIAMSLEQCIRWRAHPLHGIIDVFARIRFVGIGGVARFSIFAERTASNPRASGVKWQIIIHSIREIPDSVLRRLGPKGVASGSYAPWSHHAVHVIATIIGIEHIPDAVRLKRVTAADHIRFASRMPMMMMARRRSRSNKHK